MHHKVTLDPDDPFLVGHCKECVITDLIVSGDLKDTAVDVHRCIRLRVIALNLHASAIFQGNGPAVLRRCSRDDQGSPVHEDGDIIEGQNELIVCTVQKQCASGAQRPGAAETEILSCDHRVDRTGLCYIAVQRGRKLNIGILEMHMGKVTGTGAVKADLLAPAAVEGHKVLPRSTEAAAVAGLLDQIAADKECSRCQLAGMASTIGDQVSFHANHIIGHQHLQGTAAAGDDDAFILVHHRDARHVIIPADVQLTVIDKQIAANLVEIPDLHPAAAQVDLAASEHKGIGHEDLLAADAVAVQLPCAVDAEGLRRDLQHDVIVQLKPADSAGKDNIRVFKVYAGKTVAGVLEADGLAAGAVEHKLMIPAGAERAAAHFGKVARQIERAPGHFAAVAACQEAAVHAYLVRVKNHFQRSGAAVVVDISGLEGAAGRDDIIVPVDAHGALVNIDGAALLIQISDNVQLSAVQVHRPGGDHVAVHRQRVAAQVQVVEAGNTHDAVIARQHDGIHVNDSRFDAGVIHLYTARGGQAAVNGEVMGIAIEDAHPHAAQRYHIVIKAQIADLVVLRAFKTDGVRSVRSKSQQQALGGSEVGSLRIAVLLPKISFEYNGAGRENVRLLGLDDHVTVNDEAPVTVGHRQPARGGEVCAGIIELLPIIAMHDQLAAADIQCTACVDQVAVDLQGMPVQVQIAVGDGVILLDDQIPGQTHRGLHHAIPACAEQVAAEA